MDMNIETERLVIRKLEKGDRAHYEALKREGRSLRGMPHEEARQKMFEDLWQEAFSPQTVGCMIFEKETGAFVGYISLFTKRLPPELGIELLESQQNMGYGPEAVRAFLTYFAYRHGLKEVQLRIWESNAHSRHMFEKLGAAFCERRPLYSAERMKQIYEMFPSKDGSVPESPAYLVYRLAC